MHALYPGMTQPLSRRMLGRLFVGFLALIVPAGVLAGALHGTVVAVTDGDTVKVLDAGDVQHVIRLSGIDAPEKKMPYGQLSKQNLSDLVYGKQVIVEGEKIDRYGRLVGKVMVEGQDVNLSQIKAGMAWHYKLYQREQSPADQKTYSDAEGIARLSKLGLWSDAEPVPPWEWRIQKKSQY